MNESVNKLLAECRRLKAIPSKQRMSEWLQAWATFSELQDKHLALGEGLLELEPLAQLNPNVSGDMA